MKTLSWLLLALLFTIILAFGCQLVTMRSQISDMTDQLTVLDQNYRFLNLEYCKLTNPELVRTYNRALWERERKKPYINLVEGVFYGTNQKSPRK